MTSYPVKPTHAILAGGVPYFMEFAQGTGTAILPGDLVQFTAPGADCTVKAAVVDSTEVIGVANIHPIPGATPPRGGDRVTAFAATDMVEIIRGSIAVMLRIASSQTIECGEFVQAAGSGEVQAYVCGTDNDCQRIAQAMETTAQDTTTFQWGFFVMERVG